MESRIHGDVYVRFGGERLETYRPKGRQGALRLACGGGKTLIMCCGAYEKKRLGLANKPMIIGLKANIHEIARTFCTAYPMAKVLYPGKEDFTPRKRERIFREIRNNDWDAVILSHEQFGMIPQSPEIQQEILQAELDCVEENLEVLKAQGRDVSRGPSIRRLYTPYSMHAPFQGERRLQPLFSLYARQARYRLANRSL